MKRFREKHPLLASLIILAVMFAGLPAGNVLVGIAAAVPPLTEFLGDYGIQLLAELSMLVEEKLQDSVAHPREGNKGMTYEDYRAEIAGCRSPCGHSAGAADGLPPSGDQPGAVREVPPPLSPLLQRGQLVPLGCGGGCDPGNEGL